MSSIAPTTISLLIALISVAINALPVIQKFAMVDAAYPQVALLATGADGTVEFSVINSGRATATLWQGSISIADKAAPPGTAPYWIPLAFPRAQNPPEFRSLKSEETRTLTAVIAPDLPTDAYRLLAMTKAKPDAFGCRTLLQFTSLKGPVDNGAEVDCRYLAPLGGFVPPKPAAPEAAAPAKVTRSR